MDWRRSFFQASLLFWSRDAFEIGIALVAYVLETIFIVRQSLTKCNFVSFMQNLIESSILGLARMGLIAAIYSIDDVFYERPLIEI